MFLSSYLRTVVIVQSLVMSDAFQGAHQASLTFTVSWSLLKSMSIELVMLSNHLILCYSLILWSSIFPSIRVFSNEEALRIGWPKYWRFSFSPSNECSGEIIFRWNHIIYFIVIWLLVKCRGPALVDPGNSKVGTASASLEKYIFNYRYTERLETDSVVGRLVGSKGVKYPLEVTEVRCD